MILKPFFFLYRLILSPALHLLSGSLMGCRFEPSCSQYSQEAIEVYGLPRGALFALKRILRCHPFSNVTTDPVPKELSHGS